MDRDHQRELAIELQGQLDTVIVDEAERRRAKQDLENALATPGAEGDRRLGEVLRSRSETRAWMRDRDPDLGDVDRIIELGGPATAVGTYYVCPFNDFDYIAESVGETVPLCPEHHVPLNPATE